MPASRTCQCGTSRPLSAELTWAHGAGLRGVNFPAPRAGVRFFDDPAWEPFWAACEEFGMPLATHAGVGNPAEWAGPIAGALAPLEAAGYPVTKGLHRLIFGGVFERHPKLKIVYTEQTAQPSMWWIPGQRGVRLRVAEAALAGARALPAAAVGVHAAHVFLGASFLHRAPDEPWKASRGGYAGNILWGSDYPHTEGTLVEYGDGRSTTRTSLSYIFSGTQDSRAPDRGGEHGGDLRHGHGQASPRGRAHRRSDLWGAERGARSARSPRLLVRKRLTRAIAKAGARPVGRAPAFSAPACRLRAWSARRADHVGEIGLAQRAARLALAGPCRDQARPRTP